MALRACRPVGTAYLGLVTELLQRRRLADPFGGLWEAADLQWWYTRDAHPADADATVWLDDGGAPIVAAVFTRWSATHYGCDVLGSASFAPAWEFIRDRSAALPGATIEMEVAQGDDATAAEAARVGLGEVRRTLAVTWLDAADRPAVREMPAGYELVARPRQTGPHPMVARNGSEVESRLRECSLYDPELDLAVIAPDGGPAAYAMFWADARTSVGLVEPMRVEDEHSGRGIGAALLRAGLHRLAKRGCRRLKVSHEVDNEAAGRLYRGAGFEPRQRVLVLARPPCRARAQRGGRAASWRSPGPHGS